jgi:hypothetical protein
MTVMTVWAPGVASGADEEWNEKRQRDNGRQLILKTMQHGAG